MVAAASVSHGRQRESVHCPRRWYFCAWRRLPGSRSETVEDDAGEETPCTTLTVDQLQCGVRGRMRHMRCGGRVRRCRRGGARRLRCRGEVYFAVGIENGEYSGVLLWVPGWGWLGRVNLKLRKQPPTKRHL